MRIRRLSGETMQSKSDLQQLALSTGFISDRDPLVGFANTGTRFGKYLQAGPLQRSKRNSAMQAGAQTDRRYAPRCIARLVDLPNGTADAGTVHDLANKYGVAAGSINPNLFRTRSSSLARCAILRRRFASGRLRTCSIQLQSRANLDRATYRSGFPMDRTIPARRASAGALNGWKRRSKRRTRSWRRISGC